MPYCFARVQHDHNNNKMESNMFTASPSPAIVKRPDNRIIQSQNERQVLDALNRYGYLLTRQVAALVWPKSGSQRQAQRTLANLKEAGLVEQQFTLIQGDIVFCLTAAGARRLTELTGLEVRSGENNVTRIRKHDGHRSLANDVCIWWQGYESEALGGVNTEHQIASGDGVVSKVPQLPGEMKGKVPDSLLFLKSTDGGITTPTFWVEVEHSDKSSKEMRHMVSFLAHMLAGYGNNAFELGHKGHILNFAVFACPDAGHEQKVLRAVLLRAARGGYSTSRLLDLFIIWRPQGELVTMRNMLNVHPKVRDEFKKSSIWYHIKPEEGIPAQ
jgi:hypothetical protein